MTDRTKHTVENWAKLGYVVFAADIYGMVPKDAVESGKQTSVYRNDRALMKARTQAGFDALIKQPTVDASKIAMIGYCFGGTVSVEFGSTGAPLLANIVIHGSYAGHAPGWAKNLKGRFIMLHGAEDPNYPTEVDKVIAELRSAKAEWEMNLYSGTGHGFSHPKNKAEERANEQATAHVVRTLKELFGS
jgi:dienelactone hydrolase